MSDADRLYRKYLRYCKPRASTDWVEWSRKGGIIMTTKANTKWTGPYDVWRVPALAGMAYALQDPAVNHVGLKKCVQGGGSNVAYAYMASRPVLDPGPMMFMIATMDLVRKKSPGTVIPMIEASPEIMAQVPKKRDALSIAHYQFLGCDAYWIGGNSAAAASSTPIRYLHIDESNKYGQDLEEAPNTDLARKRTVTYEDFCKIIETCTPTIPGGEISALYDLGDKRRMAIACPHCGRRQFMEWRHVKYDNTLPVQQAAESARYICESAECGKPWTDAQRWEAIEHTARNFPDYGWIATAVSQKRGLVTFHYPALLSPFVKMGTIVTDWINAQGRPDKMRDVVNNWFAEEFEHEKKTTKSTTLDNCKAAYTWGTSPENDPHIKAMTAGLDFRIFTHGDVQKNGIWALTQIYWATGHSALLSFQFVGGYKELDEFSHKEWDIQGKKWKSHFVSIDCGDGNRTKEIYDQSAAYGFIASKGANRDLPMLFEYKEWNLETGRAGGDGLVIPGIYLDTAAIKHNLVAVMDNTQPIPPEDFAAGVRPKGPQFWLPSDIPETVPRQLTSEEYDIGEGVWKIKKGRAGSDGNHLLDCGVNVYGMATFNQLCFREIQ